MENQSSLGQFKVYRNPSFNFLTLAEIANTALYDTGDCYIEVKLLGSGGTTVPVMVLENGVKYDFNIGDIVLIGHLMSQKIQPCLIAVLSGHSKNSGVLNILKEGNLKVTTPTEHKDIMTIDPDGTVKVLAPGSTSETFSIAPDGTVRVLPPGSSSVSIAIMPDGTVRVGQIEDLEAKINDLESRIEALERLV